MSSLVRLVFDPKQSWTGIPDGSISPRLAIIGRDRQGESLTLTFQGAGCMNMIYEMIHILLFLHEAQHTLYSILPGLRMEHRSCGSVDSNEKI